MGNWRTVLLILLAAVLGIVAILTWGSLGSSICIYCLILLGAALLTQRFILYRDTDDYQMED